MKPGKQRGNHDAALAGPRAGAGQKAAGGQRARAGGRKRRGIEADWQALRYVFVVTYGRSGSTLLQSLLNSCKGVQIRGENGNVLYHLYRAAMAARSTRQIGKTPQTVVPDGPWYGAGEVRPVLFESELIGNFVRTVLAPDDGIQVTGFKEIRYNRNFVPHDQFVGYHGFSAEPLSQCQDRVQLTSG